MAKYGLTADLGQRTKKGTMITAATQSAAAADVAGVIEIRENNAEQIAHAIDRALASALEEIGLTTERFAKTETPVDTGRLRNSITHALDMGERAVYIGTNVEYAPYIENDVHVGGKMRTGHHMLRNAAQNHADFYQEIVKKHMQNA